MLTRFYAVAMDRPNMVTFLIMACGALVRVKVGEKIWFIFWILKLFCFWLFFKKDKSGNTPLHFCNNESIAKTLVAHGAGTQVNLANAQVFNKENHKFFVNFFFFRLIFRAIRLCTLRLLLVALLLQMCCSLRVEVLSAFCFSPLFLLLLLLVSRHDSQKQRWTHAC